MVPQEQNKEIAAANFGQEAARASASQAASGSSSTMSCTEHRAVSILDKMATCINDNFLRGETAADTHPSTNLVICRNLF